MTTRSFSLRTVLIGWLVLGLLVAGIAAALATYHRAREEANVLFDYQLQQMAASLTGMPLAASMPPGTPPGADALVVQVWDRNGVQVYLSQPQSRLPQRAQLGFNTIATETGEWRVFSMLAGEQVVQVAQPMSVRRALATSMALRTILPLLAVVPLLALLVWITISGGLRPLDRLAAMLSRRTPRELEPLPESGLPTEVTPLVRALNGLLGRLEEARNAQRTFIADAAHELRTPLTAVDLQAQLAQRAANEQERAAAFAELAQGLERATHLVEQLLTLAREEPGVTERPMALVDVTALVQEVIAERASLAMARGVDLGFATQEAAQPVTVEGDRAGLYTLLANLVDNAVRYTPSGGRVDVAVATDAHGASLIVRDTGPGIPEEERPRVFDRFYRAPGTTAPGSGLGLAIVKRIAERHGASIELGPGLPPAPSDPPGRGPGLGVTVRFPPRSAPGQPRLTTSRSDPIEGRDRELFASH
ncbi:MAG TPA: ATP-binding protein [Casimicrobiaceae bacterium]|nr:ATP-binding protein [Casimicrobiaceae bacterium]